MPKPQEDFSVAAAPLKANDDIPYPPKAKLAKGPRP
jgi:hypothetical protein